MRARLRDYGEIKEKGKIQGPRSVMAINQIKVTVNGRAVPTVSKFTVTRPDLILCNQIGSNTYKVEIKLDRDVSHSWKLLYKNSYATRYSCEYCGDQSIIRGSIRPSPGVCPIKVFQDA